MSMANPSSNGGLGGKGETNRKKVPLIWFIISMWRRKEYWPTSAWDKSFWSTLILVFGKKVGASFDSSMFLTVAFVALLAPANAVGKVHAVKGTDADVQEEKSGLVLAVQHLLGPKLIAKLGEGYDKVNKNVYNFFLEVEKLGLIEIVNKDEVKNELHVDVDHAEAVPNHHVH